MAKENRWRSLGSRALYSLAISAGIEFALLAIFLGSTCTTHLDFRASLLGPFLVLPTLYPVLIPAWLVLTIINFAFSPSRWNKLSYALLIAIVVVIYAVPAILMITMSKPNQQPGCF